MPASLVTGGTGFIALYVIQLLLEQGHTVHTTVRSLTNKTKCKPLLEFQTRFPDQLLLFEADLLQPGSFKEAMQGCDIVYHIASPFLVPQQIKDGLKECVEPALEGTRNVLGSVNETGSVRRVVLTSSIAAMYGDCIEIMHPPHNGVLSETAWNATSSVTNNPYHYSKLVAEREAWKMQESQPERNHWDLLVLNPGLVLGPSLASNSASGSLFLIEQVYNGAYKMSGCPELYYPIVDVRDVAGAHVKAGTVKSVQQGRYLIAPEGNTVSLLEIARMVRDVHHNPRMLPGWNMPRLMMYAIAPFVGLSKAWMSGNMGVRFAIDNKRSAEDLGMTYRDRESMVKDHYLGWWEGEQRK
ncbi:NAD(P)-binding protein [Aspergillus venezuelensis]